ncbi:uncharacterized protein LOC120439254 [Oreochromis aureus]|uniref:uncharacterized protein LOC120439254 n=1 Tax=Oreochromis aureus TaxID=47969 RepID=UPI001953951C|nr:uncharacterized protein LOC120439254 [Oreochromis aureus]
MQTQIEYEVKTIKSKHLKLNDLKQEAQDSYLYKKYLHKEDIPEYPRPELHVSCLKHDTNQQGLCGIRADEGFKASQKLSLVWWSLAVRPEEIQSAETRLLDETYPKRTEEQAAKQENFLWRFASSPAFSEKSRYGSYRFTFPVEEVLTAYREQFCSGAPPIMRVFKTKLFKQEVEYAVLVHSPAKQELFSEYPLFLYDDPNAVCTYRDGRFVWRPEAMCETHSYELIQRPDENQMTARPWSWRPPFYVWDHVALALHVENGQMLKFDADRLRANLTFCDQDNVKLPLKFNFDRFEDAKKVVRHLWPKSTPLKREPSIWGFTAEQPNNNPLTKEEEDSMEFENSQQ